MARMKSPSNERVDPGTHAAVFVESLFLIGHPAQKLGTLLAAREDRVYLLEVVQYRGRAEEAENTDSLNSVYHVSR
jgi:hypothetical protein